MYGQAAVSQIRFVYSLAIRNIHDTHIENGTAVFGEYLPTDIIHQQNLSILIFSLRSISAITSVIKPVTLPFSSEPQ